jgi:glyoxalase family protein
MSSELLGIHHVTAIASDPQRNLEFYSQVLGLRFVKKTVNYDDPGTYHFYYGDEIGRPGTVLTFFPWPGARRGRSGTGQVTVTSFLIPEGATGFWMERLKSHNIVSSVLSHHFGEEVLTFSDPDGMQLELVASPLAKARQPWDKGPVPGEQALRGFHGVTMAEEGYERTAELLTRTLGFQYVGESGSRFRYQVGRAESSGFVDVLCLPSIARGQIAAGSVHHVAWRTADDNQHQEWHQQIAKLGYNISPIMDRQYFHSIYFREPGGVLFEIATDVPGFTVDESVEKLGTRLSLPSWLEPMRAQLEQTLPPVRREV